MAIRLIIVTHKVPDWIKIGFDDYAKRLTSPFNLTLVEIIAEKRSASHLTRILARESEKILNLLKPNHWVVALDSRGKLWDTETFTVELDQWASASRPIDLIVGGPEGLSKSVLDRADIRWSLSPLTFPHHLVRVLVAEQIYRASCILKNHPYHR